MSENEMIEWVAHVLHNPNLLADEGTPVDDLAREDWSELAETQRRILRYQARLAIKAHTAALSAAGYAIVPVATAEQLAEFESEHKRIGESIEETRQSIRRGARRSTHRFSGV